MIKKVVVGVLAVVGALAILAVVIGAIVAVVSFGGGLSEVSGGDQTTTSANKTIEVRVGGDEGVPFGGNITTGSGSRSIEGTTPQTFTIEGVSPDEFVTVSAQKDQADQSELTLEMSVGGEVIQRASTTAEFGVVSGNYPPN